MKCTLPLIQSNQFQLRRCMHLLNMSHAMQNSSCVPRWICTWTMRHEYIHEQKTDQRQTRNCALASSHPCQSMRIMLCVHECILVALSDRAIISAVESHYNEIMEPTKNFTEAEIHFEIMWDLASHKRIRFRHANIHAVTVLWPCGLVEIWGGQCTCALMRMCTKYRWHAHWNRRFEWCARYVVALILQ